MVRIDYRTPLHWAALLVGAAGPFYLGMGWAYAGQPPVGLVPWFLVFASMPLIWLCFRCVPQRLVADSDSLQAVWFGGRRSQWAWCELTAVETRRTWGNGFVFARLAGSWLAVDMSGKDAVRLVARLREIAEVNQAAPGSAPAACATGGNGREC